MLKITEDEIMRTATATLLKDINTRKLEIIKARVNELGYEYDKRNIYLGIENDCEVYYYSVCKNTLRLVTFTPVTDTSKLDQMSFKMQLSFEQSYY